MSVLWTVLFILLFSSCTKRDRERPLVQLIGVADTIKAFTGDTLILQLYFRDNEKLSQFKIDIHDNFDEHSHPKIYRARPWSKIIIKNLSGREQTITEKIPVFDSAAAGPYHIIVRAADASGNESEFILIDLILINTYDSIPPHITEIQFPSEGALISNSMDIKLDLNDNQTGIYLIKTKVKKSATQILFQSGDTLPVQPLQFTFIKNIAIGSSMPPGSARLEVDVFDGAYNRTRISRNIQLNP